MSSKFLKPFFQQKRIFAKSRLLRCFSQSQELNREKALFYFIRDKIKSGGPITVHEYMQLSVGSGAGYYYNKNIGNNNKIFGESGDFITSPELIQVFGELVAVWIYNELGNTGHRGEWQLVEFGPGTGTLMADILRVLQRFEENKLTVHLVEVSDSLIDEQEKTLCGSVTKNIEGKSYVRRSRSLFGVTISWYKDFNDLPDGFTAFVGNEFLDALPVHQFTKSGKGWHEVYVNLDKNEKLCFMLSKSENLHTRGIIPEYVRTNEKRRHFEVSPEAGTIVSQVADKVTTNGGFGLFIDYGHDDTRKDLSLRAYHKHNLVNPLENPGKYDLTADVNFGYLKHIIQEQALCFGPVEQRIFFAQLGILARMHYLMRQAKSKSDRENLYSAYKMLMTSTEEGGMGSAFKCFSIFPKSISTIMQKRGGFPDGFRPMKSNSFAKPTNSES